MIAYSLRRGADVRALAGAQQPADTGEHPVWIRPQFGAARFEDIEDGRDQTPATHRKAGHPDSCAVHAALRGLDITHPDGARRDHKRTLGRLIGRSHRKHVHQCADLGLTHSIT